MFKKDKDEDDAKAPETVKNKKDETAYEDSWYRSLKALSDRPADENDEQVGAPED
jgi:hypothetical protein